MINAIVTDIEGTTSSLSFVKDTLFPYARNKLAYYIYANSDEDLFKQQVNDVIKLSCGEVSIDATLGEVILLLQRWIDEDRKITSLKTLQGLIWEQGYIQGDYKGHVYSDAYDSLQHWHKQGVLLSVYSSGSVYAQKLLFQHTEFGDITPFFSNYFDTHVGNKGDITSYHRIAAQIGLAPVNMLFLSDIVVELDAAHAAGFQTWQLVRGDEISATGSHRQARSFADITL